jgi:type IV secretory pathway VirB10-like protein
MADATAPETPAAPAAAAPAPPAAAPPESAASAAPKVKHKKATQRACDEKDAKGKLCCGHLKRWYDYPQEVEAIIGKKAEVYRCEFCKTLYTPDLSRAPHSYTLRY